jgi:hypothetical protein
MALTASYTNLGATTAVAGVQVQAVAQVDGLGNVATPGGTTTATIVAGTGTTVQVVKASAGRLYRVLVTGATSTAALTFYDNASAASGTVIGIVPSGATTGQSFDIQMPANNGITAGLLSGSASVTVSYY